MGDVPNQSRESEKLFWENPKIASGGALFPWIENFSVEKPIKQEFVFASGKGICNGYKVKCTTKWQEICSLFRYIASPSSPSPN